MGDLKERREKRGKHGGNLAPTGIHGVSGFAETGDLDGVGRKARDDGKTVRRFSQVQLPIGADNDVSGRFAVRSFLLLFSQIRKWTSWLGKSNRDKMRRNVNTNQDPVSTEGMIRCYCVQKWFGKGEDGRRWVLHENLGEYPRPRLILIIQPTHGQNAPQHHAGCDMSTQPIFSYSSRRGVLCTQSCSLAGSKPSTRAMDTLPSSSRLERCHLYIRQICFDKDSANDSYLFRFRQASIGWSDVIVIKKCG